MSAISLREERYREYCRIPSTLRFILDGLSDDLANELLSAKVSNDHSHRTGKRGILYFKRDNIWVFITQSGSHLVLLQDEEDNDTFRPYRLFDTNEREDYLYFLNGSSKVDVEYGQSILRTRECVICNRLLLKKDFTDRQWTRRQRKCRDCLK